MHPMSCQPHDNHMTNAPNQHNRHVIATLFFAGLCVAAQGGEEGGDVQVRVSRAQLQLQEGGIEGVHRQTLSSCAQGLQARLAAL